MSSTNSYDLSIRSRLKRLTPIDHARMVLFPVLVAFGVLILIIGESVTDALPMSSFLFVLAGGMGFQLYTAWNAVQRSTEKPDDQTAE